MPLQEKKERLLRELIGGRYLKTKKIIEAFRKVKRENFILPGQKEHAYANYPLPIGKNQTISQPLTVASMTEALKPRKGDKILEIGSGSGYQAAILSEIVGKKGKIITMERIHELFLFAKKNVRNYKNVFVFEGDGTLGYEGEAPYDRIIVTASAPRVPKALFEQLKEKGIIIMPIGDEMFRVTKKNGKMKKEFLGYYVFVPLIGEDGYRE
jgi:protein-L-isoaspartate(D-aspartate) O-methyltransferase